MQKSIRLAKILTKSQGWGATFYVHSIDSFFAFLHD